MKKTSVLVAILFISGMALGHGGSHSSLPEPGHTPGSMMYGFEQAYESASLALTFNEEAKVKKKVSFAQERLAESAHLAQENQTENAAEASDLYLETMKQAEKMANRTGNDNLTEHVKDKQAENMEVLKDLKNRLPEEASQGLNKAIENSNRNRQSGKMEREMSGFVATGRAMN
jgi:hypothetical protein